MLRGRSAPDVTLSISTRARVARVRPLWAGAPRRPDACTAAPGSRPPRRKSPRYLPGGECASRPVTGSKKTASDRAPGGAVIAAPQARRAGGNPSRPSQGRLRPSASQHPAGAAPAAPRTPWLRANMMPGTIFRGYCRNSLNFTAREEASLVSHSHTISALHPEAASWASAALSRSMLRSSLGSQ